MYWFAKKNDIIHALKSVGNQFTSISTWWKALNKHNHDVHGFVWPIKITHNPEWNIYLQKPKYIKHCAMPHHNEYFAYIGKHIY